MIIMDLPTLVVNAFVQLNKQTEEIRKIKLKEVISFHTILKEKANEKGINYIEKLNSTSFYELKFNYAPFFDVYEDSGDYIVCLKNAITINDLITSFQKPNFYLQSILSEIEINSIFTSSKKR